MSPICTEKTGSIGNRLVVEIASSRQLDGRWFGNDTEVSMHSSSDPDTAAWRFRNVQYAGSILLRPVFLLRNRYFLLVISLADFLYQIFPMSCPKCQEGFVLPGDPIGTIDRDFLGAYHASAPNGETSKHALIFLTDGFGLPLKNCKIMADNLAKRLECDVWIPDYFDGQFKQAVQGCPPRIFLRFTI
jgi:hypothetical protein